MFASKCQRRCVTATGRSSAATTTSSARPSTPSSDTAAMRSSTDTCPRSPHPQRSSRSINRDFVVVKFQGEDVDGVEFFAAPTKWINFSEKDGRPSAKEKIQIYWPPQSTPPNLVTKMARKETGPQSDWTLHSAILKRYYASYLEARQGARLAEETSNLESDECGKRRRQRKRRYDESSSDEDEYSHNSKKVNPPPHFFDKEIAVPKYHKKADNNQPSTSTASGRRKAESTIQKTGIGCSDERKGESMENDAPVNAKRQKIRSSDFQPFSGEDAAAQEIGRNDTGQPLQNVDDLQGTLDVVLRELGSQRKLISLLNSKMDILVMNQAQTNRTLTPPLKRVERPPNLPPFPVTSHVKLEKVERFLDNKSNFAATMDYLSCYVLQDDAKSISVMMGKIMTNKLAVEFNYNGKPPKEAFNKLRLKEVILGAILLKHPESDLVVAESAIKNWLKYAKKRKQEGDDDEDDEYDDEDDYDDIELNGRL